MRFIFLNFSSDRLWRSRVLKNIISEMLLTMLFFSSSFLRGQGFGWNKVQYEKFDFHVQKTTHFSVHHTFDTAFARDISYLNERWYRRYEKIFLDTFYFPLPVIIYPDHADFQQTEVVSGLIDVGTGGVTEGLKNRLVMPLGGSYRSTDHVLGHEMVHMFQYHLLRTSDTMRLESIYYVPLWMVEGMAEYLSLGNENTLTAMWMRDAVLHNDVPPIKKINYDLRYNPYRYGHALWSYIAGNWGDTIVRKLFLNTAQFGFEQGIRLTLGIKSDSLSALWIKAIEKTYRPQLSGLTKSYAAGKNILSEKKQGGEYYLGPSISPDGSKVVFFSERELFTIDIYLADATTGKIIRKLGQSQGGGHYDELNFISSSGAWSPDGKLFAFSVYFEGNMAIVLSNISQGKIIKTLEFKSIGSIFNIDWSPDGKQLIFSATGAVSKMADLYLYSFENDSLMQLTSDILADLHPAFSPDGRTIAFISDRGTDTDTNEFVFGKMHLCLLNLNSNKITTLPLFENTMHINPQFSPDGESLFFVADPDGISNIYRYHINTGEMRRITNVATGVSGLTELSPAITVARESGDLLFTVYDDMQLKGYSLTKEQMKGERVSIKDTFARKNILPPLSRKNAFVQSYIDSSSLTIVPDRHIKASHNYRPHLNLDYIGGLYAGAGISQYGSGLQGGAFFRFTDILNHHVLNTAIQANGRISDIAAMGLYVNQSRRFHWGGYASHIPYISYSINSRLDTISENGSAQAYPVIDQDILRAFEDKFALIGSYPFSKINRIDVTAGETFVNYTNTRTTYFPVEAPVEDKVETVKLPAPSGINYTTISGAFIGDNSFFGITDPMKGYRYRFEAEGIFNSYSFVNIIADYRRYFYVKPASFAFRLLHYGRYFKDAENKNLTPVYLGNEFFMHGYSIYTFSTEECAGDPNCPSFNRLLGSKLGVMNLELRLPLTGPRRMAVIKSKGYFSTLNIFLDGGIAWMDSSPPELIFVQSSEKRIPVISTGVAYRINVFGVMVLEFYYAYPFQRPQRDWHFGFQIMPGW